MSTSSILRPLCYFTIEDESILAEAFEKLEEGTYAITFKVAGSDDVFVTTSATKEVMDLHDIPYHLLAQEESSKIGLYHSAISREELSDYEDGIRALTVACRAIGAACVGVNGDADLGFDLSEGVKKHTYFTVPAGHTFIFRLFSARDEAVDFLSKFTANDVEATQWAESLPLASASELVSFH